MTNLASILPPPAAAKLLDTRAAWPLGVASILIGVALRATQRQANRRPKMTYIEQALTTLSRAASLSPLQVASGRIWCYYVKELCFLA